MWCYSVYPSYPEGATLENMSLVLIVSYCWTQDAERLGALMNGDGTARPELIDLVFHDLAAVHGVNVQWLRQFYTEGRYFAWDWLRDPLTMGSSFFAGGCSDSYRPFQADLRSLVRACMKTVTSTTKCSDLLQVASYSSPERRPVPVMRMWIHRQSCRYASDPNFINSWVAGALNSAWRAVDQYLLLNQPDSVRDEFWRLWGPTEYWDEAAKIESVNSDHDLMERHLVISLYQDGYTLPA